MVSSNSGIKRKLIRTKGIYGETIQDFFGHFEKKTEARKNAKLKGILMKTLKKGYSWPPGAIPHALQHTLAHTGSCNDPIVCHSSWTQPQISLSP